MNRIAHDFSDGLSCLERIVRRIERKTHLANAVWFLAGMAFMALLVMWVEAGS